MTRADPNDRENIPCRKGGAMHRHVRGEPRCGDCNALIVVGERFIRAAVLDRDVAA